jgi:hypothetical protein
MFLTSHLLHPCWFTAIEHGRKHAGTAEQRARQWQHLQSQGVKQGVADVLILAPGFALMAELKAGANKQSEAQVAMQRVMEALQHGYAVCRSVEQLGEALQRHGIPLAAGWQVAALHHDAALDVPTKGHNKPPRARAAKPSAGGLAKLAKARASGVFT